MTTWVGKIYSIVPCSGNEMKEIPVDNLCLLTGWLACAPPTFWIHTCHARLRLTLEKCWNFWIISQVLIKYVVAGGGSVNKLEKVECSNYHNNNNSLTKMLPSKVPMNLIMQNYLWAMQPVWPYSAKCFNFAKILNVYGNFCAFIEYLAKFGNYWTVVEIYFLIPLVLPTHKT